MPIPKKKQGEKQSDFMMRCVPQLMKYHEKEQAIAMCYKQFQGSEIELESYNDYPQGAVNNAKRALKYKKENGTKCGTQVGWTRASQLASREKLSESTIARMAQFNRHRENATIDPQYKDTPWKDRGYVAWNLWGGTSGVNWAIKKIKQIRDE